MPTYRYRCSNCGDEFEVWQSIKDDSLTVHDTCNGKLLKVMTPAGIVLKGSGFYKTDSRSGSGSRKTSTSGDGSKQDSAPKKEHSSGSEGSGSGDSSAGSSTSSSVGTTTKDSSGSSSNGSPSSP